MSDREELIRNAIAFLSDPKSQSSPLAQRIQFLEAKGLTPPEIDLAVRQATNQSAAAAIPYNPGFPPAFGSPYPAQQWDWRDYFITAVASGTILYGAVSLFQKYLSPHLQPPETTVYEGDRDALTAQFDAAEVLLKEIQSETAAVKQAVQDQKEKVDKTTRDVEAAVSEMRSAEARARDEMREIREEVNTIRDMLPKMIEKNKDTQTQSLAELQQELKSLKALLLSRGPNVSSTPPPAPMVGRPSIPSWQLASNNNPSNPGPTSFTTPSPAITSLSPSNTAFTNGKGKEREEPALTITS
ncbi:peroxisomal membrane anchor protein conserved region-domain-containing protein [Lentinula edodes]|uniref:peroxisomal membrane anchor protein conserved region-domain-containing protein n=1 Tax=Lentinula edodes TaxID=5353 RepID=UPI001E8CEC56|nr:peroxisomal membrane anchor protein conserved region-domain-containing protein [Lentinula edodes]KAH7880649.1 peroxisomal membrane anchor protein conserved region-domain-containing protein [Lentinula edodes]KAJ3909794.1 peroxisomal membrane anchor protein conserved region-domain-containing protein [Lentinula edodes]